MSKPKRRCPACGSTNPADAVSCCVCGFVFAATVGSETAAAHPPEPSASTPDALETPAHPVGDGAKIQHTAITDSADWAGPQVQAVEAGAPPEQCPHHAAAHRRGMISLPALLALTALSAIGLLAVAVFRSVAEESTMPLSVRPTAATAPHLEITSEVSSTDLLTPTTTPLPSPTPTETPLPSPTPTETPSPTPTPLPTPTEVMRPTDAPASSPTKPPARVTTYRVQQGDTCWGIATRFGISVEQLIAQNRLSAQCVIRPGQVLTIRR